MPSPSRFANITRRLEDLLSDGGQAVYRERQKSTLVSRSKPSARRSEMGHEERFPPRSLSGRCGVDESCRHCSGAQCPRRSHRSRRRVACVYGAKPARAVASLMRYRRARRCMGCNISCIHRGIWARGLMGIGARVCYSSPGGSIRR